MQGFYRLSSCHRSSAAENSFEHDLSEGGISYLGSASALQFPFASPIVGDGELRLLSEVAKSSNTAV